MLTRGRGSGRHGEGSGKLFDGTIVVEVVGAAEGAAEGESNAGRRRQFGAEQRICRRQIGVIDFRRRESEERRLVDADVGGGEAAGEFARKRV